MGTNLEMCTGCVLLVARLEELERRHDALREKIVQHVNRVSAAIGRVDADAQSALEQIEQRLDALLRGCGTDKRDQEAEQLRPRPLFSDDEKGPYAKGA